MKIWTGAAWSTTTTSVQAEIDTLEAQVATLQTDLDTAEASLATKLDGTTHDTRDHSTALGTAVLDDLSDVVITSPAAGHVITRSGSNWVNAAPTAGLTKISDQSLGAASTTITFSSIPQTYSSLILHLYSAGTSNSTVPNITWNGITSAYGYMSIVAGSTPTNGSSESSIQVYYGSGTTSALVAHMTFPMYTSASPKIVDINSYAPPIAGNAARVIGNNSNTAAITSIVVGAGFSMNVGTRAVLWGMS